MLPTVGFIGLGMMGLPMLRCLLKAGCTVRGFDLNPQAAASVAGEAGFSGAASPADAASGADVVLLMLPDSRIVDALLWGPDGGLARLLKPGQVVLDMGSSDPVRSRENQAKLAALRVDFVDAPVSGGVKRAVDGSLVVHANRGGLERVRPLLQCMGKTLVHVGTAGAGHAVKALNNYVSASGLLAVCEALVAARAFGIDPHLVNQVFNASTGKNNTTDVKVEAFMLSQTFNSGFALALMRKDLQTALAFIERMGTPADFATRCLATWADADTALGAGADHTALFKYIQDRA